MVKYELVDKNNKIQYFSGRRHHRDVDSDEEDSMFGSFNPNLNTKEGSKSSNRFNRRGNQSESSSKLALNTQNLQMLIEKKNE
eukprot:CAMPEP_0170559370 /NCGR_PEP_ID=MMETSP0211-20121228/42247_1 /TAXON_ID=311385 /ORGANISM="Pseudokeronopsis sp., Strain OXSARD2" /LENGTH=82 /DNA_ID=CAMNT_0010872323 /DNA_START=1166 /DNA_END=1414 /DNA_ORIENTATION=+